MKSPFPGMDPYIEASDLWGDFHGHLIEKIYEEISAVLPEGYVARTGERSYIALLESGERKEYWFISDVKVSAPRDRKRTAPAASEAKSMPVLATPEMEPVDLRAFIEEEFKEKFLDVYELQPERRLITSIEVLSPSNKRRGSEGWQQYLRKRQALLRGKANLVELDLLRDGDRLPMLDPWPGSPYTLLVARKELAPRCRVWPASFDQPLPTIPIPLAKPHPDIPLALQPLVEVIYERGRYSEGIDYSKLLDPPLTAEQSAWLAQQLRGREAAGKARPARTRRSRSKSDRSGT
ncbi:MAG: DUF4058 family protein [Gemmataceae bacterium]|nr:DUF4058 family protein [Gemmataceae bacterium]